MNNWTPITIADLEDHKVAALVNALRNAARAQNQADPVPAIIQSVVDRIRAEVAGCDRNRLDADTAKIPKSLKVLACQMILAAAKNRLEIALTDDERTQQRSNERYLERIASCDVPVDMPDNPIAAAVQQGGRIRVVTSTPRRATRERMRGL